MKVAKLGVISCTVPQDVECKFCGNDGLTGTPVVLSSDAQITICSDCIMAFAGGVEAAYDVLIGDTEGATFH